MFSLPALKVYGSRGAGFLPLAFCSRYSEWFASVIQFPRWGWTVFSGLISFGLGVYLLATWPAASTYFVGVVIGIDLLFDGASLVGFAGAISSLPKASDVAA